jgi:hypothetical protein
MKTKLKQIAIDLANWSKKYLREHTYPMNKMSMDDELIEIEERAKKAVESEPTPQPVQKNDTPYWVIERKCDSGFKYWQIFNQMWVDDIHTATKWYIKSEAEAYLIHGHFKDDYVAEHMDVSESKQTHINSDGYYSPIAKLVWSYLKYTECDINGEHTTLIENKEVWEMIKALEFQIHDELMRLKKLARIFRDDDKQPEPTPQPNRVKSAEDVLEEMHGINWRDRIGVNTINYFDYKSFDVDDYMERCNKKELAEMLVNGNIFLKGINPAIHQVINPKPTPQTDINTNADYSRPSMYGNTQPESPTAEEVLWNETTKSMQAILDTNKEFKSCILDAMHEYHNQFPQLNLREELIKYDEWFDNASIENLIRSDMKPVDQYLNKDK